MFLLPFPQIDPALFTLELGGFSFSLRWYALAYIAGLLLGWRAVVWLMRRPSLWPLGRAPMTPDQPEALLTWMTLGVVLGGRLGYVLFYNFNHYLANPLEILAVWTGGMSFHGGFIGVIIGVVAFCRRNDLPVIQVGDAVAMAAPFGILFGRIANFINGELWGRVSDVPWAMNFPNGGPAPRHPSQLYEAGLEGATLAVLLWLLGVRYGWLRRPGAVTGMFFIGYGAARAFVENFRQMDAQLGYVFELGSGGLTMGQILSLPMPLIGLAFLALAWGRRGA